MPLTCGYFLIKSVTYLHSEFLIIPFDMVFDDCLCLEMPENDR